LETFSWREGLSADAHVLTDTERNFTSPAASNERTGGLAVRALRSPAGSGLIDRGHASQPAGYAEHAGRTVRVRAVRRGPPDLDRFVAALLALALAETDTERTTVEKGAMR
jgi:hypothetical protein